MKAIFSVAEVFVTTVSSMSAGASTRGQMCRSLSHRVRPHDIAMRVAPLPLLLLILLVPVGAQESIPFEETQAGMNETAAKSLKTAEAEMAAVFDSLIKLEAGKEAAIVKLRESQSAWTKYRDAQVGAMWPFPDRTSYGSVNPMCIADARTALTRLRIDELRSMLNPTEGDLCASQWPD